MNKEQTKEKFTMQLEQTAKELILENLDEKLEMKSAILGHKSFISKVN